MFFTFAILACAGSDPPARSAAPAPAAPAPPGGHPTDPRPSRPMPGAIARTPESLTSSWTDALAVDVPPLVSAAACPDADGDTFVDAWSCPNTPPNLADCDDHDARVTPSTERFVRPGPFLMGSASAESGWDERPVHVVSMSGYCLEVAEHVAGDGVPLEGISWDQARTTCAAVGMRLPTEAEWEKAARGGCELGSDPAHCDIDDLRAYPWGNGEAPACTNSNHQAFGAAGPALCEAKAHALGGALNTSPYGMKDMSGNLWEYVADWYHMRVYGGGAARVDPLGPRTGDTHVLRGGGWNTFSTNMRVSNRFVSVVQGSAVGVRCARGDVRGTWDDVAPVAMVTLRGEIVSTAGKLEGVAINLAAFDSADLDAQTGMPNPGRSPMVEVAIAAEGGQKQPFELSVPQGHTYQITAGMDIGQATASPTPGQQGFRARSGSGGFGKVNGLVNAEADVSGLVMTMSAPPAPPAPPPGRPPG